MQFSEQQTWAAKNTSCKRKEFLLDLGNGHQICSTPLVIIHKTT